MPQRRLALALALSAALVVATPSLARAQGPFETVGARAIGMAGAFVAVADDASAVYWNPAGLATAGPAGMTIGWAQFRTGDQSGAVSPGNMSRRGSFLTSIGAMPLGISHLRLDQTSFLSGPDDRPLSQAFQTSQYAVTLLQTVTQGVVVATNLKLVRGTVTEADATGRLASHAFDSATSGSGHTSTAFDMDIGVMVDMAPIRIGFTLRNLRRPEFAPLAGSAASSPVALNRQARMGVAYVSGHGLTLAMDLDVVTVDLPDGPRRDLAFGGEQRLSARLVARGGVRWNLHGEPGRTAAAGVSVLLRPHLWLDAHATRGGITAERGYGVALRVGF